MLQSRLPSATLLTHNAEISSIEGLAYEHSLLIVEAQAMGPENVYEAAKN